MKCQKGIFFYFYIISVPLLFLVLVITTDAFPSDSCIECHRDVKFRVENKVLFDYYNNWKGSVHDLAGVSCKDCHGGDPAKVKKEEAHPDHLSPDDSSSMVFYKNIPATCGKCHEKIYANFVQSDHYKALEKTGKGPNCVTCHGSVVTNVYYASIIVSTCVICHNQQTQNHPQIISVAEQILQRLNVSKGYLKWTSIHYKDEPGKLTEVKALYQHISDSWHQFHLETTDQDSVKLQSDLEALFNEAYEKEKQ